MSYHGAVADTKYKAVFMDFYGTVAGGDAEAVARICTRIVTEVGLPMTPNALARHWGERFFAHIDACEANGFRTLYACECAGLIETCEALGHHRVDPQPYVDDLFAYMSEPPLHPEVLDVLAEINVPVCCVSNADSGHLQAAIDHHRLPFAKVVCSEEARAYKPASGLFERALTICGHSAAEVLHVGDSLHADVGGAVRAGIDVAWVCREARIHDIGNAVPNHKISCLRGLREILS